ncbi:proliferation marker protein Ki-67 isoform X2 [Podarcis raffonei]|uniref:proliferation marker protein Ki-67 isoform X2 n=1 Tax=Podarcis raffonei TaxID=65483 RepID=UPI00232914E7|nr:proliferation marker protein Ki-67 isoform X2 [Podarcis raffonei]
MPLFGKIVVIKKNGSDGTHFPLTRNSCLFGRKRECDIRIQLPQVSKEHCKIEVNENKEATLFNLSPANPTELNGNIFQQPTYLKHGDVFTIIDRSFRFEYPPSLLPRKRSSRSQENETLQVLHILQEEQEELLHCRNSESKSPQISEVKKSPKKRKDEEPDILIQPLGKRKRVSFGGHLSPELFDKRLPPNSPLKRGATPARLSLPFGNSPRAVLKFRQSRIKSFPEGVQHENISSKNAASPSARRSPVASPAARKSPVASPTARKSPVASPAARKSPVASPSARKSPVASPAARKSLVASPAACKSPVASPAARKSPVASPAARKSPVASPAARKSPVVSPAARRSPVASPSARKSPVASPAARKSLVASPAACKSPVASPAARKSPVASPAARKSPVASPAARRSPVVSPAARRSPVASPPARRSPVASPQATFSFDAPQRRGRFSVSHVTSPPSEEQDALSSQMNGDEEFTEVKTSGPTVQECKAARSTKRSKNAIPRSSLCRRSGVMGVIHSKRQSGASKANLIVAKSWADIVKQGVPKSQVSSAAKCGLKRSAKKRSAKKNSTKPSKNNVSMLKTPIRKVKGHFTTGHANSPAPIVIGKAHTSIVNAAAQVPKVMINYPLKKHDDLNESFTGLAEIFNTPLTGLPSSAQKTTIPTPEVVPEMHTPEESGEMSVSPFSAASQQKLYNQDVISPFLKEVSQISGLEQDDLTTTPKITNSSLEKDVGKNMSLVTAANEATIQGVMEDKRKGPEQKLEPVEAFSGVKRLLRTLKQKPEPVDALSGVKRVLRTPKQKPEPVDALSGVKRVLRTPKQKPEPVDALSGVKRLLRTPKESLQSVADDTVCSKFIINHVIKAPKEKVEAVEDMGGIHRLLRTPKQRFEPMDDMVGISRLLKTPKQKFLPVDDYLGLQKFMTEPKQSFPSPEVDYTGVKEMLEAADGQKAELPEFVNLMKEDNGSCMSSRESMRNDYENKEAKLESSPKRISPLPKPKDNSKNISELENNLGHVACNTFSELKSEAVIEPVEIMCVSESHQLKEMDSENGHKIDFVKEPVANSGAVDREIVGPLASARRTRRADKSRSVKEHDAKNTQRHTSSTQRAEPVNCVQANENFDQNITEINLKQESESNTSAVESEGEMAARQTEASLDLEENAEIQDKIKNQDFETSGVENAGNVILKRNRRGKAASIQAELFTTNTDVNEAKKESLRHTTPKTHVLEKTATEVKENNVRRKGRKVHLLCDNSVPLEEKRMLGDKDGAYEEQKSASIASQQEIQNEENPGEAQKVPLESVQTPEMHSPPRRQTVAPRRGRSKQAISQETTIECDSKQAADTEDQNMPVTVKENRPKRGRGRRAVPECQIPPLLENVALTKESPTVDSFGSTQEKCYLQETQTKENIDEMPKMPLESKQPLLEHSPPKRQKIAKGNPPRRGRSKQTISPETLTECDSKQAADTEDQNMPVIVKENPPRRGRGRRAAPVCSVTLPLEDIPLTSERPTANSISSAPGKCSLDEIQNEEKPNETEEVPLEGLQTPAKYCPARKQKVANRMLPKRGKSKQAISQETSMECESKQTADKKDQAMVVTIKDNQLKRGRRRVVPVSHMTSPLGNITPAYEGATVDSFSSAQGKRSLQEIHTEENLDEMRKMPLESEQPLLEHSPPKRQKIAKGNPPRRGRSKQTISPKIPTECDSEQTADTEDQNMLVTVKESQPKRGRGRRAVPECQIPPPLENVALKKESPTVGSLSSTQGKCSLQDTQNEKNLDEMPKMPLESVQPLLEHSPPKGQNLAKGNSLRRGRNKQTISPEILPECDSKQAGDTEDQNMLVTVKENQLKRGRGRKTAAVTALSPLKNNILLLPSSTKSKGAVEQPSEALEIATVASENLPRRGRRRKAEEVIAASSVSASKKPILLDTGNQEDMPEVLKGLTIDNVSKRGRRKQFVPSEISTEGNGQPGSDNRKVSFVKDNKMPLESSSVFQNQSKGKRVKRTTPSPVHPSLKVSITLTSPPPDKGETASKNQNTLLENDAIGKGKLEKCGRRNKNKIVTPSMSVRRKHNLPEKEDFQEKQNVDFGKLAIPNEKISRRGRRVDALEAPISASLRTRRSLNAGGDNAPKDQQMILKNKSKSKAESIEKTPLKKEKKKTVKEEHSKSTVKPAGETEGKTRGRKTKKNVL